MKKLFKIIFTSMLVLSILLLGVISSSAMFGSGVAAVAKDVNLIKTGLLGQKLCFNDSDFKSALCISDFDAITITEIPSSKEGTLLIAGRRVGKDRVIKRKNLASLVFIPTSGTVTEAKFKFKVDESAEIECIMKFIDKVNYAPSVEESTVNASVVKTQESISVFGKLEATDPEGDALQFITVIYPKHGTLEFVDEATGKYRYIPEDGYTGKDKFTYVVRDEYGNYTKAETVTIRITERMCETVYRDMTDREEYNAAVAMTAMGIMDGRLLGDDSYFLPDEKVSRAEFVTMAMKCTGIKADTTLTETFFDDDEDIPASLKNYVATAQRLGFISGDFVNGKLTYSPNDEITRYEAAKILSCIIGSENESEESVFAEEYDVPVWARAGVHTMCSLGIFSEEDSSTLSDTLTRANTANYLYKMLENS